MLDTLRSIGYKTNWICFVSNDVPSWDKVFNGDGPQATLVHIPKKDILVLPAVHLKRYAFDL